jgi:hypothetical protein
VTVLEVDRIEIQRETDTAGTMISRWNGMPGSSNAAARYAA